MENRIEKKISMRKKERKIFLYILAFNIRVRTSQAFNCQNVIKSNKTFDLMDVLIFFRKRIFYQTQGNMTGEKYGSVWIINHCYLLSKINLSNENEMIKSTFWRRLRPMYCSGNFSKRSKNDHRSYLKQEVKAKKNLKLNEKSVI